VSNKPSKKKTQQFIKKLLKDMIQNIKDAEYFVGMTKTGEVEFRVTFNKKF